MIHFGRTDVSEEIDVNVISVSKECGICHCCYFLNYSFNQMSAIDVMTY